MRGPAQCPHCREVDERRQSMHEVSSGTRSHELHAVYLHEMDAADVHSGKLTLRCEQGHTTVVTLPIPLFELLFDFEAAPHDWTVIREKRSRKFAAPFERFEEFACRFLLARRNVSFEGVDAWWKEAATNSERQLGAFRPRISDFRGPPPLLPGRSGSSLGTTASTKGESPPESEAKAYGEAVLRTEVTGIVRFRNCFDNELEYDDFVENHIIRPGASGSPSEFRWEYSP